MREKHTTTAINVFALLTLLCLMGIRQSEAANDNQAPPQAAAVGYDRSTFHSNLQDDLDLKDSRAPHHKWYLAKWFGWPSTQSPSLHAETDGALTLTTSDGRANYTMGSAAETKKPAPNDWVGTAFGGGGYFEADFKFDPKAVMTPGAVGFPAWWLEPLEHSRGAAMLPQWKGQPAGYEHFVEVDVFEYDVWPHHPNIYSGAVHDWYGIHNLTCPGYCKVNNDGQQSKFSNYLIETPVNTDFRQYHKFGVLWVPATEHTQGYLQYYFDGKPTGDRISWSQYHDEPPPPSKSTPWAFGVLDRQHLVLILGTGTNQAMTVRSVNVWQKSSSENLYH